VTTAAVSRAACALDLEGDGDQDFFVITLDGRATLLRNDTPRAGRHWLGVRLAASAPNRQAIGARVEVEVAGRVRARQLWRTRGFLGSSEPRLLFGLGEAPQVEVVRVRWPDGRRSEHRDLAADRTHTLTAPVSAP